MEVAGGVTGLHGVVLPIFRKEGFPGRSIPPGMPILLNQIRLLAFIAVFCVSWLNAAVGKPVEAPGTERRIPGEATVQYRIRSAWERHRELILATAAVIGLQSILIVGLIVQRSRRKRAERSLRDSEERMSLAAEAANLGMWVWDVGRDEVWTTDKGRALFGIEPDTRLDHATLIARVHPEDRVARDSAIRRAIETRGEYALSIACCCRMGRCAGSARGATA